MSRIISRSRPARGGLVQLLLVVALVGVAASPLGPARVRGESVPDHLVISEIVTGGASASDEFIEIYNPTATHLPLEGLELVYVTASGLTISRRAAWDVGAPEVPSRHHLLIANEAGVYAGIADAHYASGLAATGGSLALRIQGAATAIDAVGWGNAASAWLEGVPAPAPAAGSSIERLPGGPMGSTRDTDDNASDFTVRLLPDPQNSTSAPTPDDGTASPTPTPLPTGSTPSGSPSPSPSSTPAPTPDPAVSVALARALPDGTRVTIEATTLTGSTFAEGGGYVADATAGIAVLVSAGSFERGQLLRVTGTVDDRFAQRTLRASGADVMVVGPGSEPEPLLRATGAIGEGVEGRLVRTAGRIIGSPTSLSAGPAYEIDDGSGPIRVVVGSGTGIVTTAWASGSHVELVGVVGQRDSSGTGASGYRLQPRDPADVLSVGAETPSPAPSGSPPPGGTSPIPTPSPQPGAVMSIAEARALPKHAAARVRGTVTLAPGLVDPVSAVIQDGTGAILLRVGDEVGPLARGERVEISGVRSTLAGMETLRVTGPALRLGVGSDPIPVSLRTGDAGEALEAQLVRVRGALAASARRVSSGTVSFEVDDGSGPLRVYLAAPLGADTTGLVSGAWVEATGVLGQETTGAQPLRGYRVWPRTAAEVVVGASPTAPAGADAAPVTGASGRSGGGGGTAGASLAEIADTPADLAALHVGATLVHGPWPELGVAALLWDGERVVAIASESERGVRSLLADARPPVLVELTGLAARGAEPRTGAPLVAIGTAPGDAVLRDGQPHPPAAGSDGPGARWVSLVGRLAGADDRLQLLVPEGSVAVQLLCDDRPARPFGSVQVIGVGLGEPWRLLVPCGGVRPAPSLHRPMANTFAAASLALAERGPRGEVPTPSDDVDNLRGLAAALLGIGSLAVTGAAVIARRSRLDPGPFDAAQGGTVGDDGGVEPAVPRALTLVSVPRERGSP